ncbi:hypothetical protein NP233_g4143 [Leucocoprinus birnbaumii]|uniref:Uncharacterized protein n=1 Tax=Leucocoprinus birnbaumii TaxID=56174 RepID=A0AAD5YVT1_9AGAR|nr:hypothetical protein NP233_g4143 [Leucocoprinus birnbaumii]
MTTTKLTSNDIIELIKHVGCFGTVDVVVQVLTVLFPNLPPQKNRRKALISDGEHSIHAVLIAGDGDTIPTFLHINRALYFESDWDRECYPFPIGALHDLTIEESVPLIRGLVTFKSALDVIDDKNSPMVSIHLLDNSGEIEAQAYGATAE